MAKSLQRVGPDDAAGSGTLAQLYAGRGEYESFQIVVKAPATTALSNVNVTVSNLTGPAGAVIPRANLTLFREQYVHIGTSSPNWGGSNRPLPTGWYPDGLIPFNDPQTGTPLSGAQLTAVPFSLNASKNQPIWVDVLVPRGTTAGLYSGTFTVTSNQGSVTGQISLTVWNFTLPLQPALNSSFLIWNNNNTAAQEELLRNRINPQKASVSDERMLMDSFGLSSHDTGFWSGADIGTCTMSAAPSVSSIKTAAATHQSGLLLYDYSADEIWNCPNLYPTVKQWGFNLHQAGVKNLITMAPVPDLFDDGSGTNHSAVDIWVMLPVMYDGNLANVQAALAKGDQAWSYNCLVQDAYSPKWEIDFSPMNFRVQPGFINASLNLTGILYWRVDLWSSDPWNNVYTSGFTNYPGDGMLVYPGANVGIQGVAPSMRLKWLRDGVEDYDYIALLKQAGQGAWATQVAGGVGANWSSWSQDPNVAEAARYQLGHQLDLLGGGGSTAPTAPANPAPSDGALSVPLATTLSWTGDSSATGYDVYFGSTSSPAMVGSSTTASYNPGTLTANTTYYWRVVAKNSAGSTSSATWSFATAQSAPGAPGSLSPANGATGVSLTPVLTWSAASNATSYDVYFGSAATPPLAGNTTATSYSPGTLVSNTVYYWRVVAKNTAGSTSSSTGSFTTLQSTPVPGAPGNLSPANGATGVSQTPALTWSAASDATSYDVYFGTAATPPLVGNTAATNYSPGTLAANTTYYWKITAKNSVGSTSSYTCSFTTLQSTPVPGAPGNLSPANGATGVSQTPALTWSAAPNATSYDVYFGTAAAPPLAGNTVATNYSPGTLAANTTYYWKIVAKNSVGSTSSYTCSFTTLQSTPVPGAPGSLSPANGATGVSQTPALTWSAASNATSYDVYFGTAATPPLAGNTAATSYAPGSLGASTTYYWRVVAKNSAGSMSSATVSFTTTAPAPPPPSTPGTVSPSLGAGYSQTFTFVFSGLNGVKNTNVLFNASPSGQYACWFNYDVSAWTLSLARDDTSAWDYAALGSSTTLKNSQCSLLVSAATASVSGSSLTLVVPVTFTLSFSGLKNIYLRVQDGTGVLGDFAQVGSWSVPITRTGKKLR